MSYDYSSASNKLEMPNPYRVQNMLLLCCAALLVLGGLASLWISRAYLHPAAIAMGLALLVVGLTFGATAAKRLRFYFGRGRPHSLAPDLGPAATAGTSPQAEYHKGLLRQGALIYPEPSGAMDGILYHLSPRLITAPLAVQHQARTHFFNLGALLATTLSFAVAWMVFGTPATRPWLSAGYFVFGALFLIRPVSASSTAKISTGSLVMLIAAAVLGPALLGAMTKSLPSAEGWSLASQTTTMLLAGMIAVTLTMLATLGQVQPAPATQTSSELLALSLNVPPSLLMDELDRRLQSEWTEKVPNRRYSRRMPVLDPALHSGPFSGELFEETQPMPMANATPQNLGQALASARHKWVSVLDLYAAGLTVAATACALWFTAKIGAAPDERELSLPLLSAASIFFLVASFAFKSAAKLWGRFDFESTLIWVEMSGTYQTASVGTGNAMTSQMQTSNQVVRTESMTLRVWRARIESVVFGKDGYRQVTAMFSTDNETKELASHLASFGASRATLVTPGSKADLARLETLAAAERMLGTAVKSSGAAPAIQSEAQAALGIGDVDVATAEAETHFCHACGKKAALEAVFCSGCGTKLNR